MARTLSQFTVLPDGEGDFILSLEDDDAESHDFVASYEQLALIVEALEETMEADDDTLDDDEEDEEERD